MKRCSKCNQNKNSDQFYKVLSRKDKLSVYCKSCCVTATIESRNNPKGGYRKSKYTLGTWEYHRDNTLRSKYGVTLDQYNDIYNLQEGKCKICNRQQDTLKKALNVDHNHVTNNIRGLLCNNCNRGLGHFMDSKELLIKAIKYLSV